MHIVCKEISLSQTSSLTRSFIEEVALVGAESSYSQEKEKGEGPVRLLAVSLLRAQKQIDHRDCEGRIARAPVRHTLYSCETRKKGRVVV